MHEKKSSIYKYKIFNSFIIFSSLNSSSSSHSSTQNDSKYIKIRCKHVLYKNVTQSLEALKELIPLLNVPFKICETLDFLTIVEYSSYNLFISYKNLQKFSKIFYTISNYSYLFMEMYKCISVLLGAFYPFISLFSHDVTMDRF